MSQELIASFRQIVGARHVLHSAEQIAYYCTGFRSGKGTALAVVFPATPLEQWQVLAAAVKANCIIIMQAAKTGLTEGSAPKGDDYDRDVVIINITRIKKIVLLDGGRQVLAFAGATLFELERELEKVGRAPHSVIGSTTIGATIVGGIANSSGGALVKRGPAYTELALYAQVDSEGELHLVNHLGIDIPGSSPEQILTNLYQDEIAAETVGGWDKKASASDYIEHIRNVDATVPNRFNADKRRLFEASGCAGKIAVFAVRVDTWPVPKQQQVFYIGTNSPEKLEYLRRDMLQNFENLPEMGEYIHRELFSIAKKYGKDVFLSIKHIGTRALPRAYALKARVENALNRVPFLPRYLPDRLLFHISRLFPQHLPQRLLAYEKRFAHHLIVKMSDGGIAEARQYLAETWGDDDDFDYFECTEEESRAALLHRFAVAGSAIRYQTVHSDRCSEVVSLDIAMPPNDFGWTEELPAEITEQLDVALHCGHFMCHVFHRDYIFKKGTDLEKMKELLLAQLDARGAKYPAEHNVGHLYNAEEHLKAFYRELDPTNTFNPGIGKTAKTSPKVCL